MPASRHNLQEHVIFCTSTLYTSSVHALPQTNPSFPFHVDKHLPEYSIYLLPKKKSIQYICVFFFHYVRADPSGPFFGFQSVLLYSDQGLAPYSFKHSNYWMSPNRNNPIVESLTRAVHTITIAAYPKPGSTPMDWFCVHHGYSTFRCLLS